MLYMFRTTLASIIRSTYWPWNSTVRTDLEHLYRIYSNPTHDKHQWLLLQFIVLLKTDAKGVRNMQSILVVFKKHNTARVASCWFIIYYRLVMHGNSNIKKIGQFCFEWVWYIPANTGYKRQWLAKVWRRILVFGAGNLGL